MWEKFNYLRESRSYQHLAPMLYAALSTLAIMGFAFLTPDGPLAPYDHRVTIVFSFFSFLSGYWGIFDLNNMMKRVPKLIHPELHEFLTARPYYEQCWLRYIHEGRHAMLTLIMYSVFLAFMAGGFIYYDYVLLTGAPVYMILFTLWMYFMFAMIFYYLRAQRTYQKIVTISQEVRESEVPPPVVSE